MKKINLKLEMDLIPETSWFKSLFNYYKEIGRYSDWQKIKKKIYELEGYRCWICKSTEKPLEAHESWGYNKKKKIQKLIAIHHICGMCHKIKHFGLWTEMKPEWLALRGITKEDLIEHFCKVNNCSRKEFEEHSDKSFNTWYERSEIKWKPDVSFIKKLGLDIEIPKKLPKKEW